MLRDEFYIRDVNGITTTVSSSARNIKPAVLHGGSILPAMVLVLIVKENLSCL